MSDFPSDWPTAKECADLYNAMTNQTQTFWLGVAKERQANRAAAFGAIRRAAEVARGWDFIAGHYDYRWQGENARDTAEAIRAAIRAAIGSEKT